MTWEENGMDFKSHFERGWNTVWRFVGPVLLLTVVQMIVSFLSLGILAPVTGAGYMHSLLLAMREGRTPEVRDLFSQMSLFLPLFLFGFFAVAVIGLGFLLLFIPGIAIAVGISFAFLYLVPLMTDKNLKIMDALKESWSMAKRDPVSDQIIITIIYLGIFTVGASIPLGYIVATPIATAILLSVYEERIMPDSVKEEREKGPDPVQPMGPPPPPPPPQPE
jgi:hypothetical protein